jgi:hypothetical protein
VSSGVLARSYIAYNIVIRACKKAICCLQGGPPDIQEQRDIHRNNNHLDMVEQTISVLEDDPNLNAGLFPV